MIMSAIMFSTVLVLVLVVIVIIITSARTPTILRTPARFFCVVSSPRALLHTVVFAPSLAIKAGLTLVLRWDRLIAPFDRTDLDGNEVELHSAFVFRREGFTTVAVLRKGFLDRRWRRNGRRRNR